MPRGLMIARRPTAPSTADNLLRFVEIVKNLENPRAPRGKKEQALNWLRTQTTCSQAENKDTYIDNFLKDILQLLLLHDNQEWRNEHPELDLFYERRKEVLRDINLYKKYRVQRAVREARNFNLNQQHTNLISLHNIPRNRKMQYNRQVYNAHSLANHINHAKSHRPPRTPTVPHSRRAFTATEMRAILHLAKKTGRDARRSQRRQS